MSINYALLTKLASKCIFPINRRRHFLISSAIRRLSNKEIDKKTDDGTIRYFFQNHTNICIVMLIGFSCKIKHLVR